MLATACFLALLGVRHAALDAAQPEIIAVAEACRDFLESHPNPLAAALGKPCPEDRV